MALQAQGSLLAGRYRVVSRLGTGGMATVLLCHDQRLDRHVAVKRLHANSPDDLEARFLREAKVGASLNHPNLVAVFDTEVDDEGVLIVMEHVEGEPLGRALRRGPLEPPAAARVARDLGEALDHAHAHGVVHRDVKPSNVLLRRDGMAKLADLGIAVAADQTRITRSGTVLGSAAYMAPEQLEGGEIGPAVDVYALSAVLFEVLSGERARGGRTPLEIAHSIATEGPPDVRAQAPWVPAEAAEALAQGMAHTPSERPGSAGELAARVAGALERSEATAERTARTAVLPGATAAAGAGLTAPRPAPTASRPAPAGSHAAPTGTAPVRSHAAPRSPRSRLLAPALVLLAVAAVAAAVLVSAGDGDGARERAQGGGQGQADGSGQGRSGGDRAGGADSGAGSGGGASETGPSETGPSESAPEETAPAGPAPEDPASAGPAADVDPERGVALNEQGFALMGQGDYAGAVPVLQQAVASWPEDSRDLNYAYALYNLGVSLSNSGRAAEAIPYLEKRLTWSNQRGVVMKELRAARANAG